MARILALGVLCATLAIYGGCSRHESEKDFEQVAMTASDGVKIAGFVQRPTRNIRTQPPGLILVHAVGRDSHSWEGFAAAAAKCGIVSVAVDIRGHGLSTHSSAGELDYRKFVTKDWLAALADIEAARKCLLEQGANPDNIAIAGASIGANLALRYATQHPDMQGVVLLSPGLDYKGVTTEDALQLLGRRPILLMTAEGDSYSASSCGTLKSLATGLCELRQYPGTAHGTDLVDSNRTATEQVLLWLSDIIGNEKPES